MSDDTFDLSNALPFDQDAYDPTTPTKDGMSFGVGAFSYIGRGLTLDEFQAYVATYTFGAVPPSYIVFHHTAIPSASYARYPTGAVWDAGEAGMSVQEKYDKRKGQLDKLRNYYRDSYGWTAGPHLFIDDTWIWLFTPMYDVGIHAAQGNSRTVDGKLKYGVGIEVIGYYEHSIWPPAVQRLVGGAVAILKHQLKTFDWIDGPWEGKVGAHRMYNKPSCPGGAITPAFYLEVCRKAERELFDGTAPGVARQPAGTFIIAPPLARAWQASGGIWQPDRLTPGYAVSPLEPQPNGTVIQWFERAAARLNPTTGEITWLLLDEMLQLKGGA